MSAKTGQVRSDLRWIWTKPRLLFQELRPRQSGCDLPPPHDGASQQRARPPTVSDGREVPATAEASQVKFLAAISDTNTEYSSLFHSGPSYRNRASAALSLADRLGKLPLFTPSVLERLRPSLNRNDVSAEGLQGWYGLGARRARHLGPRDLPDYADPLA